MQGAGTYVVRAPLIASDAGSTPPPPLQAFEVVFLDVGQGDAILVTVAGQRLLIDAGRGATTALIRLQARGINALDAQPLRYSRSGADRIQGAG